MILTTLYILAFISCIGFVASLLVALLQTRAINMKFSEMIKKITRYKTNNEFRMSFHQSAGW